MEMEKLYKARTMAALEIETLIIGGGQAGLATSYYLTHQHHKHLVLEQSEKPAAMWRNRIWDSFTLVTPNWALKMPGVKIMAMSATPSRRATSSLNSLKSSNHLWPTGKVQNRGNFGHANGGWNVPHPNHLK